MTITLTDTFVHADGTPATGSVQYRYATTFFEPSGHRTVVGEWQSQRLASDGSVTITLEPPAADHTPAEQYLTIMEDVSCSRGWIYAIPADVLTDGATLYLGAFRTVPELPEPPSYVGGGGGGMPGPPGPQGPEGPQGPPGPAGATWLTGSAAPNDSLGNDGDQYYQTTGYIWLKQNGTWSATSNLNGPQGPPGPAGQDAQLPAGTPGQVLQFQGTSWQPSDNLMSALARTDGLEDQVNDIVGETPMAWDPAATYHPFDIVTHNGDLYIAARTTHPGDEPGVDPKWDEADIGGLYARTRHWRPPQPADPGDDNKVMVASGGDASWQDPPAAGMPHWTGTAAEYAAIAQPDPGTVYLITA